MFACTAPATSPYLFANNCPYKRRRFSPVNFDKRPEIRYQIFEDSNEYTVELNREVPKEMVQNFVMSHIRNYQDTIPRYRVVTDWFGNQYYVENELDQDIINREVLEKIDWKKFGNRVGKKLFSDYHIELNHSGTKLLVKSEKDILKHVFTFDHEVEDVEVASFQLSEEFDSVLLRLRLLKKSTNQKCKSVQCDANVEAAKTEVVNTKSHRKQKKHNHHHKSKPVKKATAQENKEQPQSANETLKTTLSHQTQPRTETVKIDIQFDSSVNQETPASTNSSRRNSVSSTSSVQLEEVEDEETARWQRSLSQSPAGHSILEDI